MLRAAFTFCIVAHGVVAAWSQEGFLGTKSDVVKAAPATQAAAGSGLMPLVQMAVVAGIAMLVLKVVIPKLTSKLNRRISPTIGGGIRVEESATFAGGSLYVVSARKKTLLLCASGQGVSCLADLTDPAPTCEEPLFVDILSDATQRTPAHSSAVVAANAPVPSTDAASVEAALRRIRELSV